MRRRAMLLVVLAVLLTTVILAAWLGSRRQHRDLYAQLDRLMKYAESAAADASIENLESLPAPVARYLRWAVPGRRAVRFVRLHQVGTLRTGVDTDRWMAFEAEHVGVPRAVGFLWNARVKIGPLLHVRVRDAYLMGQGSGQVSLLSAFTVAAQAGTPQMNSGSLHRFLAEAVWYPTALFPSSKLRWNAIDAHSALATLTDHGISVSLEFRFAETGEVTGIYTPARWGTFGGGFEQHPWEGHFRNYQLRGGIFVPTEGDVAWQVDNQWHPVWRGTVTSFEAHDAAD
jgi:hypothetical protein